MHSNHLIKSMLLLLILACIPILAKGEAKKIDKLLQSYHDIGQFNGVALVAKDGKIIYEKGFGMANFEWQIPNTPDTKFRIGSVTKQFAAALILQLVEDGKVDIQANIRTYIPDYPEKTGNIITVHHLLTHTSGIPNYTSLPDFRNHIRNPYTPDEFVATFSELELDFEPGSSWSYSNSGYFLLGVIVEKVTGNSWEEELQSRILKPLGMTNSGYQNNDDLILQMSSGYSNTIASVQPAAYLDTSLPYAAGMMYSTVHDMLKWDQALYGNGPFKKAHTKSLMFTKHAEVPGDRANHYGYGWFLHTLEVGDKKIDVIEHAGGINGFSARFWRMPTERATIVIFDNTASGGTGQAVRDVAKIIHGGEADMPKQGIARAMRKMIEQKGVEKAIAQYHELKKNKSDAYNFGEGELNRLGYYYLGNKETGTAIAVFKLNVEVHPDASNPYDSLGEAYMAAGQNDLAIVNYKKALELNPGMGSAISALEKLGVKMEDPTVEVPDEVLTSYVGVYEMQPGVNMTITKNEQQLSAQLTGQPALEIFPSTENDFFLKAVNARLVFTREGDKPASQVTLHQGGRTAEMKRIK
ncbi:MAG: serine hydrolase [Calditrichia bacterium]